MTAAIYLPLLLGPALALIARRTAGRGAPGPTAHGLTVAAVLAAASSTWSLLLLALTLLDDLPPLAARDGPGLNLPEPVPGPVALLAAMLLAAAAVRLARDAHRRYDTHRELRAAGSPSDGLVVADLPAPMAVAVPGRPGHMLITTGLLRELDAGERRVVFAHERAHLAHRHHRLVALAAGAAAVNPLLIRVRDAVGYLVERWADEDAALAVGDRDLAARAVARAALATVRQGPGPAAALGMNGSAAVLRVRALGEPSPVPRRRQLIGPVMLGAGSVAAAAVATAQFVAIARVWL
jgi:Peptidase family M48